MLPSASSVCPVLLVVLLLGSAARTRAETDWEAAMVADVVHDAHKPSIYATLCWTTHRKLQLQSALMKTGRTVQFFEPSRLPPRFQHLQHVVFLVDLGCENITEYLIMSKAQRRFSSPFRWILIARPENGIYPRHWIPEAMIDIEVLPDCEVLVTQPLTSISYEMFFIYKTGIGAQWRTESYGRWDRHNRFQRNTQLEDITALRRINLHKYEISAALVFTNPESAKHLDDGVDEHEDTVTKVNAKTIEHLIEYLNGTKKILNVESWGYKVNGTWTFMCGMLYNEEIEIGGSPCYITQERLNFMAFVSMPTPTDQRFVFIQPKLSYTQNLYLLSFSPAVWKSLMVLVLVMFLVLVAVAKWEWRRNQYEVPGRENYKARKSRTLRSNLTDVAIVVIGAICQQGSPFELKGSLGRVVTFLLFLTLMFVYTAYSANIVALLQSSSSQIRTLEDLLYSRIKLGVDDTLYNRFFFSIASKPTQKALYQTKIAPPGAPPRFIKMEDGVRNIQKGLFAFHMEVGVGYKFVNKLFHEGEKCGLQEIDFLQLPNPWQSVRKFTPYMEMYKIGFKRIQEAGLQTKQNLFLYDKRPKCAGRDSNFISVSMVDCYPALLELAYGMIIAIFVFLLEILLEKRKRILNRICCKQGYMN